MHTIYPGTKLNTAKQAVMRQINVFCKEKKITKHTKIMYTSLGTDMEKNKHRHHAMR